MFKPLSADCTTNNDPSAILGKKTLTKQLTMLRNTLILALLAIVLLPAQLLSQGDGMVRQHITSRGDTLNVSPYALTEINSAIEALDRQLVMINNELLPNDEILRIESVIDASKEHINDEQLKILSISDELSNGQLDDISKEWTRQKTLLKELQTSVTGKVKWCIETFEAIKIEKERWLMTKESVLKSGAPKEMANRISSIIRIINSTEAKLKTKQEKVLSMENDLTDILLVIEDSRMKIDKIKDEIESQIFTKDCPVIWNSADPTLRLGTVSSGFNTNLRRNIRITEMFFIQNKANVIRQALVFIFSIVLLLFFKTQLNKLHIPLSDNEQYYAKLITSRVVGIALLFTLISAGIIYSYIPSTIREVVIVGFIASCLMVIPKQINKRYRVYIVATLALFALHEIGFLLETKLLLYRLILMAESGFSVLIIYKIIKNRQLLFSFLEGIWWQFVWKIKYALYALSVTSIIANCLGYLNLATLLTKITAYAILFAIVLSVAQMTLLSAFTVLLHTKLSNLSYLVAKNHESIKKRLNAILQYVLVLLWIRVILNSIGYYDKFIEWIGGLLGTNWTIGTSTVSLNGILTFAFIILVASLLSRAAKQLLTVEVFPRIKLPRGIPGATSMLVSYFIGGIGIYLAILSTGIDLSKFGLIAGALGVGIGFGLQNVVHNFISGLILAFERPIQVGDTIAVGTLTGVVKSIGIRSSTISTFEGSDVIVPNSNLISNEVINWTLSNQTRRREIPVGVAYSNHPETVLEVLRNVVREHPDVLPHPLPMCLFDGFGDNSLNFRVLFWAPVDSVLSVQSSVAIAIYDALEEAGMQVPFPQRDIHIKSFEKLFDDKNPPE